MFFDWFFLGLFFVLFLSTSICVYWIHRTRKESRIRAIDSSSLVNDVTSIPTFNDIQRQLDTALHNLAVSQRFLHGDISNRQKFISVFRTELAELESIKSRFLSSDVSAKEQCNHCFNVYQFNNDQLKNNTAQNNSAQQNSTHLLSVLDELKPLMTKYASEFDCKLTWQGETNVEIAIPDHFFKKMLRELIVNALAHNSATNDISVIFHPDEQFLNISVVDFGDGISQKLISDIFDNSINRYPKGRRQTDVLSHIDLSLIMSVLRQIGGDLSFISARRFGTRVNVSIPKSRNCEALKSKAIIRELKVNPNSDILFLGGNSSFEQQLIEFMQRRYRIGRLPSADQLISVTLDKVPKIIVCSGYAISCELLALMKTINYLPGASNISLLCITEPLSNEQRCHLFENEVRQLLELPVTLPEVELVIENTLREQKRAEFRVAEAIAEYTVSQVEVDFPSDKADSFERKFLQCLEKNYADPSFSQEDCASQLFMSTRNLQRKISLYMTNSFPSCLKRYRVEVAKALIMDGETVTNAGIMVGFSSPSYFAKCFKAELGYVPSMLSRKLGNG